ncbi:MAG: hypothetical protein RL240_1538 [Planctomycetota bacterium]
MNTENNSNTKPKYSIRIGRYSARWKETLTQSRLLASFVVMMFVVIACHNAGSAANQESDAVNPTYNSARQSLEWMTKSLMRVAEKLDEVSSTLDPKATEEQISRDVKQAMREAFAEFSSWPGGPTESSASNNVSKNLPFLGAGKSANPSDKSTSKGEVASDEEIKGLEQNNSNPSSSNKKTSRVPPTSAITKPAIQGDANRPSNKLDSPIWDANAPAWVRDNVIDEEYLRIAIESSVESSLEECRSAMDQQARQQVLKLLDNHVLHYSAASEISELTDEFIKAEILKAETEYDLVFDRPSGTYHQLWKLVSIGPDAMHKIRRWDRETATRNRVTQSVTVTFASIGALAFASGISGMIAKRQTNKKRDGSL